MSSRILIISFCCVFLTANLVYFVPSYNAALDWINNEEKRLPNLRAINADCRPAFLRKFISVQDWSKPTMVALGDSQPFANGVPLENTWLYLVNQRANLGLQVINLSVIDGRLIDSKYIASHIPKNVEISFLNINQSHFAEGIFSHITPKKYTPFEFETCVFSMLRFLSLESLRLPSHGRVREEFSKIRLSKIRYNMNFEVHTQQITNAIEQINKISKRPLYFVTPNNTRAFPLYKFDLDKFVEDSRKIEQICLSVSAYCKNFSEALSKGSFGDIVHLNTKGHAELSNLLIKSYELNRP